MDQRKFIDSELIEKMIDRHGLASVLEMIAQICYEKGDHLRSNWQDETTAKVWDRDGRKIDTLASKIQVS